MNDGGQRADSIRHVIGAVGERQESSREDQRQRKQFAQRLVAVFKSGGLTRNQWARAKPADERDDDADADGLQKRQLDQGLQALQRQIGRKGAGHDGDQHRHPAPRGCDLVILIDDGRLDEGEEKGSDHATQQRGNDPACGDATHRRPVDGIDPGSGNASTHDAADNGMGGRYRRAEERCQVNPDG